MQIIKISLVIPAFNEAAIISDTIETVLGFLDVNYDDYELIVVNDGSSDKTQEIIQSYADAHLKYAGYAQRKGKGSAVRTGMLAAEGDIVVYTDADLAYGTEAVKEIINRLLQDGTELAIGSRKLHPEGYEDYPLVRLLASKLFSMLTGLFAGFQYDTQCGLKAFTSHASKEIFSRCVTNGFAFDFEAMMYAKKLGFSITQHPVKIINHRASKVNVLKDSIKMFGDIIRIRAAVNERLERESTRD